MALSFMIGLILSGGTGVPPVQASRTGGTPVPPPDSSNRTVHQ